MKTLRVIATAALAVLLLCSILAAETLALLRWTVLRPDFYGQAGRQAYSVIGDAVVEKMADAVLERAPAIVLKTADRREALRLARHALPPEEIAAILEQSGPAIARYVFYGGDLPVLKDSKVLTQGMTDVVRDMLMDGVWDMLPDKPSFPAFMPFTPEWNLGYGNGLQDALWPVRHYAGLADYALWSAAAAVTLFAGLLYLLWIRRRAGCCVTLAAVLALNGLLLATGAVLTSYHTVDLASEAARYYPVNLAADLFGPHWAALVRAITLPFRNILFWGAVASLSLGVASATAGIERTWQPWPWKALPLPNPTPAVRKRRAGRVSGPDTTARKTSRAERNGRRGTGPRHGRRAAGT